MTLYEEAGLSPEATAEEIRHAYHNLIRLLHPDLVRDPLLQSVAHAQLRRINSIFEVLNDPKRRAAYDRTLVTTALVPTLGGSLPQKRRRTDAPAGIRWILAAVLVFTSILWVLVQSQSVPAAATDIPESGTQTEAQERVTKSRRLQVIDSNKTDVARELRRLRMELQKARGERAPPQYENGAVQEEPTAAANETESASRSDLAQPATPARVASPALPAGASSSGSSISSSPGLAGTWLYARRKEDTTQQGWYPPEYVELRVQANNGGLMGRFQARYRVGDKPISPEVRFRFEGKGDVLAWAGSNGAKGELRLKQLSPLMLQVEWTTTTPAQVPSLTSGSSVLVKSPE